MRIAIGLLYSVFGIALVGCLNTNADTDIASEAITPAVTSATIDYVIKNLSSSTITLDTTSCTPSTSLFAPFFISSGSTIMFSATTDSLLFCNVRYQDQTGAQGCQFELDQNTAAGSGFASSNAYKVDGGRHIPSCNFLGQQVSSSEFKGTFTMQTN